MIEVRTYSAKSRMSDPVQLAREMLRDLSNSWELAWWLMVRDLSAKYRLTALGYFWAVFPPLLASGAFVLLERANILAVTPTGLPYPVFVFTGAIFWQLFSDAFQAPLRAVEGAKRLLVQIHFPREALVLSGVGSVLVSFAIKLALLAAVLVAYRIPLSPTAPLAIAAAGGLVLLGTVLGALLVPAGILYSDISMALPLVTTAWMILTPVAYPAPRVGLLSRVCEWNPVAPALTVARDWLLLGTTDSTSGFAWVVAGSAVFLIAVWVLFHIAIPRIAERLGT